MIKTITLYKKAILKNKHTLDNIEISRLLRIETDKTIYYLDLKNRNNLKYKDYVLESYKKEFILFIDSSIKSRWI